MTNKPLTKTEFIARLSEISDQPKTVVAQFIANLFDVCSEELKTKSIVSIPGIVKISTTTKPASEARQGINPFTKAPITIPAKPASVRVKASPAKVLKDSLGS